MPTLSKTPMPPMFRTSPRRIRSTRGTAFAGAWGGMKQGWGGAHQRADFVASQ
jgi:hypothetical protein